eukprot:RCo025051
MGDSAAEERQNMELQPFERPESVVDMSLARAPKPKTQFVGLFPRSIVPDMFLPENTQGLRQWRRKPRTGHPDPRITVARTHANVLLWGGKRPRPADNEEEGWTHPRELVPVELTLSGLVQPAPESTCYPPVHNRRPKRKRRKRLAVEPLPDLNELLQLTPRVS